MSNRRSMVGAGLLGLLAVVNIVMILVHDTPPEVLTILAILHLALLVALGVWVAGRSRRIAMWVAVVAAGLSALMSIPPLLMPDFSLGDKSYFVLFIVLTAAAIFLVRGELGRSAPSARRSTARVA